MKDSKTPLLDRMHGPGAVATPSGAARAALHQSVTLDSALRTILAKVPGVQDVRVLWRAKRRDAHRHKVFVVTSTHDVARDARIVQVMCQFDDVDLDLVPMESCSLVPEQAERFALN